MNESVKWVDGVRGTDSLRAVARRAGITSAKLIRQVNDDQLTFETVREVSRAYGRSVLADLVRLGHLTESDAGVEGVERALAAATDEQLVLEVGRRLDVAPSSVLWDAPASESVERASNVVSMKDHRGPVADDFRAVASEVSEDRGEDDGYDA